METPASYPPYWRPAVVGRDTFLPLASQLYDLNYKSGHGTFLRYSRQKGLFKVRTSWVDASADIRRGDNFRFLHLTTAGIVRTMDSNIHAGIVFIKIQYISCDIEDYVEPHLCTLFDTPIARNYVFLYTSATATALPVALALRRP